MRTFNNKIDDAIDRLDLWLDVPAWLGCSRAVWCYFAVYALAVAVGIALGIHNKN